MAFQDTYFFRPDEQDEKDGETGTVDLEESEDGSISNDNELGILKHPRERRKRTERSALYTLGGFFLVMFIALVPLHNRKDSTSGETEKKAYEEGVLDDRLARKRVFCSGRLSYTLDQWLDVEMSNTAELCDPDFKPNGEGANMSRPVKVFIMLGETNMVGAGQTVGNVPGTLDYTVTAKKRFPHLVDTNKQWKPRSDVRYVAITGDLDVKRNDWLVVDEEHEHFGPELQFGFVMGELFEEPVLLVKACSGQHSLGGDLLPPGSTPYEFRGWVYPGYGEGPRRWPAGLEPESTSWYAGHAYDMVRDNIKAVLSNIGEYYPGATSYEIGGVVFWHGDSDRRDTGYAGRYERNLRGFIANIRRDIGVPDAKVAIASIGHRGMDMSGDTLAIFESQMAMGSLFREFKETILSVDIRSSWRTLYLPGFEGDDRMRDLAHYGRNAETVMEVGNALGLAMAKLLFREESQ